MSNLLLTQILLDKLPNIVWRWVLFLYLSIVLCPIQYWAPTPENVDNTWFFALNYAAAHHLVIGRDIVWTWGPLSYLLCPLDIGNNLAEAFAFQSALWALVTLILWDLFFRDDFPIRNLMVFSIFIGLSSPDYHQRLYPGNVLLCGALILLVHFRLRGGTVRYITALVMMGLIPLIQFVGTIIVVGVTAGLIVDRLFHDDRCAWLNVAFAISVPTAVAVVGCRLAIGSFHAVATYVRSSLAFTKDYSVTMSATGPRTELFAAIVLVVLLAAALFLLMLRDRGKAWFFSLALMVPLLVNIKHGFVRQDAPHLTQFFCFIAMALSLIMLAIPLDAQPTNIGAALVLLCFAILWHDHIARNDLNGAIASFTGSRTPQLVWNALHFNHLRRSLDTEGHENYSADTRIEPEIKSIVGREPVGFLSNVYSNALLDQLNLVLSPVLQRYAASTPYLDRLNADWIRNKGPRFLLFDGITVDGRHPWTETPATWAEVYRWYNTRMLGKHNLLLERRMESRYAHFEPLSHSQVRFGEELPMPQLPGAVFWTMQCPLSTSGKLRALLLRVPAVTMTVETNDGQKTDFRVPLPMLGYPSLGNYLPNDLAQFAAVFTDGETRDFSVTKLEFGGYGKVAYQQYCEVELLTSQ